MLFALTVSFASAQDDVIKFLGIPVDGSKSEMIKKLKKKGFKYNWNTGRITGEFNGSDVTLLIDTYGRKVNRIIVLYNAIFNEVEIKDRFNDLCIQFDRNDNYACISLIMPKIAFNQTIPENEDISEEIEKKQYQALYTQLPFPKIDSYDFKRQMIKELSDSYSETEINSLVNKILEFMEKQGDAVQLQKDLSKNFPLQMIHAVNSYMLYNVGTNKSVWVTIKKHGYDKYRLAIYYENNYNSSSNGSDL